MTATLTPATNPPVECRSAAVADVRFKDRIIELIAVPYNEETEVEYRGRWVVESVLPGAFDGIETRVPPAVAPPQRAVTVNRDHDYRRTIGVAAAFHPSRTEGLVAELRVSPTPEGDDALELTNDRALGASVGMAVRPKDQRWSDGNRRRQIVRAFLDHIALVANPAYAGAVPLSIRSTDGATVDGGDLWQPPSTPRLDEVLAYTQQIDAMLTRSQ